MPVLVTEYPDPAYTGDLLDEANTEWFNQQAVDGRCTIVAHDKRVRIYADSATATEWQHKLHTSGCMSVRTYLDCFQTRKRHNA